MEYTFTLNIKDIQRLIIAMTECQLDKKISKYDAEPIINRLTCIHNMCNKDNNYNVYITVDSNNIIHGLSKSNMVYILLDLLKEERMRKLMGKDNYYDCIYKLCDYFGLLKE